MKFLARTSKVYNVATFLDRAEDLTGINRILKQLFTPEEHEQFRDAAEDDQLPARLDTVVQAFKLFDVDAKFTYANSQIELDMINSKFPPKT